MGFEGFARKFFIISVLGLAVALAGCEGDDGSDGAPGPPGPPGTQGTIIGQWEDSAHADATAEAFVHWDADGEVPTSCAKCHSKSGFLDYAEDRVVDDPAPIGSVISCAACHSSTLFDDFEIVDEGGATIDSFGTGAGIKDGVVFPSGAEVTLGGPSNICMVCHQGRASTVAVDNAIAASNFGFINIHYFAAAATLFGTEVQGGYEYAGKTYVGRFTHVKQMDTCVDCHMGPSQINHTMMPQTEYCVDCHAEVAAPSDPDNPFRDIRRSNPLDFDGDGNTTEGLYFEINDTLVPALLSAIQDYAETTIGTGIVYDAANYPYFFVDLNANRVADANEVNFGNRFSAFDATLLKAAYNYQVTQKEPCGYIHNALYVLQIIYDSIEDVGGDVTGFARPADVGLTGVQGEWASSGHGDVNAEAWNHWNADVPPEIPTTCAKCHSAEGIRDFAPDGAVDSPVVVTVTPSVGNTLTCGGCHQNSGELAASRDFATLYEDTANTALEPVTFPAENFAVQFGFTAGTFEKTLNGNSNMCMACHQGRESGLTVQDAIDAADVHSFINRHYFAAAAILFGTEVKAGYEYPNRTYLGMNAFPGHGTQLSSCVQCHMRDGELSHTFQVLLPDCSACHSDVGGTALTSFDLLGPPFGGAATDYDGDGVGESFQGEIDGMLALVLAEMQTYTAANALPDIGYLAGAYPYWFIDTDGDGVIDPATEGVFANRYVAFDDALLAAAYNYHSGQDPCSDIHNYKYVLQTLYDSVDDLNGGVADDVPNATRPAGAGGVTPPPGNGGGEPPAPDGAALYAGAGCGACHGADGASGFAPDISNISLAALVAAPPAVGTHPTILTWTPEEQQAVVDFLSNPL